MKKRIISCLLAAILCLLSVSSAFADGAKQASGRCFMSISGRTVSYSGYSESAQTEDVIKVTVKLLERRGNVWYIVGSVTSKRTNADYVDGAGSMTVTGGYYYKVQGTHYSEKNGVSYSGTSTTTMVWIP